MREVVIYHYESLGKFYLSSENYQQPDGTGLPADSTDVVPPDYVEGFIPVFTDEGWVVVKDDFWRPVYKEINYDSGHKRAEYTPLILSAFNDDFPAYPRLPQVCNTLLVSVLISQSIRDIQGKYKDLLAFHDAIFAYNLHNNIPDDIRVDLMPEYADQCSRHYKYHFIAGELVASIRSLLDYIIQITYLMVCYDEYLITRKIAINSIGSLLSGYDNNTLDDHVKMIVIGDGRSYKKDDSNFLRIINDLSNSIKHSLMHAEAFSIMSDMCPVVISFEAKNNNHNREITYHNHVACQLVMGFQDVLKNIIHNQKVYLRQKS